MGEPVSGNRSVHARVLVVDDEPQIQKVLKRFLMGAGHVVETFAVGEDAIARLGESEFDVVISDLSMPGMDGIELLRRVREHDLDIPVVLITGDPSTDSAIRAIEYGAFRYLTKPFRIDEVVALVTRAARLHEVARAKRVALELLGRREKLVGDLAGLEASLSRAMASMWLAFQPIVRTDGSIYGYEALLRSDEPALPQPLAVLEAAARLGKIQQLGRAVRRRAAEAMQNAPPDTALFLNIHPLELRDSELLSKSGSLSSLTGRVVLEISERTMLDATRDVVAQTSPLRDRGYRFAIDDVGAGYAGIAGFAAIEPELVKLDTSLVRGIDGSGRRQRVIKTLTELGDDLGIGVVAEGVETDAERRTLCELGCKLMQGYLFARPGPSLDELLQH